jgi:hypothetical protein
MCGKGIVGSSAAQGIGKEMSKGVCNRVNTGNGVDGELFGRGYIGNGDQSTSDHMCAAIKDRQQCQSLA